MTAGSRKSQHPATYAKWPLRATCATFFFMNTQPPRTVRTNLVVAAVCLLTATATTPLLADGILITTPTASPGGGDLQSYLDEQLMRAATLVSDDLGISVGYQGFSERRSIRAPSYTVSIMAADVPDNQMLMIMMSGGGSSDQFPMLGIWGPNTYRDVAATLRYLYGQLSGTARSGDAPPARYVLDWNMKFLATDDLPYSMTVYPATVRSSGSGTVMVAGQSLVVELDRYFREVSKVGVGAVDGYSWAYYMDVTPAGSVYTASGSAADVYRFVPSLPRPVRLRTGSALIAMAVLADGTLFAVTQDQQFYRFDSDGRKTVDLKAGSNFYVMMMDSGPDNTLWTWNATQRRFDIFDSDGLKIDALIPQLPQADASLMRNFAIYPDGSVLLLTTEHLIKVDANGVEQWRVDPQVEQELGSLQQFLSITLEPEAGAIYLSNTVNQRLVQLLDVDWISHHRGLSETDRRLVAVADRLRESPDNSDALADRARLLEELGAWEAAAYTWDLALGVDPFNSEAEEGLEQAEILLLKRRSRQAYARTMDALEQFGVATAAEPYRAARLLYEELLARSPGDREAARELGQLEEAYEDRSSGERRRRPLTVTEIEIPNLFPALMQRYNALPVGTVTVTNPLEEPVQAVTAGVSMRRYVDFPQPSPEVAELGPGESVTLDLFVPFNREVLSLQEDLPVQVQLTVSYSVRGDQEEVSATETVLVHRNTALVWDDSAKLASFVMPNEEVVRVFGLSTANPGPAVDRYSVSKRIFRAVRIADALGTYGINYIEDPDSPFSEIMGATDHVDTVRFPRDTLRTRIGDCDDTTALLASLYEAAGIPTAVMTSPGHVFLAFDTGEPEQNAWLFQSQNLVAMTHGGTVWLPVESTILSRGFQAAWTEASRLVSSYDPAGRIEFIPVRDARADYPALSLGPASYSVPPPSAEELDPRFHASVADVVDALYERTAQELAAGLDQSGGRARLRLLNQLGILHARFGEPDRARDRFQEATNEDPGYSASYINLANIEIMEKRPRRAIEILDQPAIRDRSSVLTNLLLAQAYAQLGDRDRAGEYLAVVEERSPQLAAQYAGLADPAQARASDAAERPVLPWAAEDNE